MDSDPPIPGIDLHPEPFPLNGNHTILIAQLAEEVGYLRGVLDALDLKSDILADIVELARNSHDRLAAIRRAASPHHPASP